MFLRMFLFFVVVAAGSASGLAQWGDILRGLGIDKSEEVDEEKAASGLKEALRIGAEKAVNQTGVVDGYFRNEAIKLLLPDTLQKMDRGFRIAGFGPQIDEFVLSMNRAAEKAAPFAKDIFWNAIKEMSFKDALGILRGGDTAATDYFKKNTSQSLRSAFKPVVQETMNEVGVTKQYKDLVARFEVFPFVQSGTLDLDDYVVSGALEGLFHVLGEEETKIRKDPAARVTDILKEVFKN